MMWLKYEAKANKRLACHNESREPVAGRQCESIPSQIHLCSAAAVPTRPEKRERSKASAGINFGPGRGNGDSVWRRGFIFSRGEQRGPRRDTKMDLHATRRPLPPAANLLLWQVSFPNSNLEDFSNLNGVCGRSGDTLERLGRARYTHTRASCFSHSLAPQRRESCIK